MNSLSSRLRGLDRSQALRRALVDAAARLRDEKAMAHDVAVLEGEADRSEMLAVVDLMARLRTRGDGFALTTLITLLGLV